MLNLVGTGPAGCATNTTRIHQQMALAASNPQGDNTVIVYGCCCCDKAMFQVRWDIYSNVTVVLLLLTTIGIIVKLCQKRIYRKNSSDASDSVDDDRERTPTSNKYTACNSENCVRCNRYHNLRSHAPEKLSAFVDKSSLSGLIRLRDSLRNDVNGAATDEVSEDEEVQRQRPNVLYVAGPESTPWWNADRFPAQTELLEKNHENIVEEFENVAPSSSGWVRNTTESGCWRAFFLINQGCRIAENCRRCPKTAELVEHCLENVMKDCVFGNVFFSVVEAGTSISAHCGPTNVRLRCHLGKH